MVRPSTEIFVVLFFVPLPVQVQKFKNIVVYHTQKCSAIHYTVYKRHIGSHTKTRHYSLEDVALVKDTGDLHEDGLGNGSTIQEHETVDTGVTTGLGQLAVSDGQRQRPDLLDLSLGHLLSLESVSLQNTEPLLHTYNTSRYISLRETT